MKNICLTFLTAALILLNTINIFSQQQDIPKEFGISVGGFTNFPANQDYLKYNIKAMYVAPYVRTGNHEFSAGIAYPLKAKALIYGDNINPRPGAMASYKYYIFNIYGRENFYIHYTFQYLRFTRPYSTDGIINDLKEIDTYINNVFGVGYNLFFDSNERFGFYYTLGYIITDGSYKVDKVTHAYNTWTSQYFWNRLNTNLGFTFKLTSLNKKSKK